MRIYEKTTNLISIWTYVICILFIFWYNLILIKDLNSTDYWMALALALALAYLLALIQDY